MLRTTACRRALIAALTLGCTDSPSAPVASSIEADPRTAAVELDPWTFETACPAGATRWVAPVSGSWFDAARWTAGIPSASVPACIDLPGSYAVTFSLFAGGSAQSLFLGVPGDATQPTLNILAGILSTGNATIHGKVDLRSQTSVNAALDVADLLAVAPTGTLTSFHDGTKTYEAARIRSAGHIEVGPRSVGVARLNLHANSIVNRGSLVSPLTRELYLRGTGGVGAPAIVLESGSVVGSGKLEQTNGSITVRGGTVTGTMKLIAGSELRLEHDGGGRFELWRGPGIVNSTTPHWMTRLVGEVGSAQHVWLGNNHITVETSGVINHGEITLNSVSALGPTSSILRPAAGETLVNAADGTISIDGNGNPRLVGSIENDGLILASDDFLLRPAPLVNRGIVRSINGSHIAAAPTTGEPPAVFVNDGGQLDLGTGRYTHTTGRFENLGGTVTPLGITTLTSMTFSGFGTWGRTLAFGANTVLAPGASPGRLEITGDYTPATSTTTALELAGDAPGSGYDQIAVSATARFAGSLTVALRDGFVPRPCQTFTVVTYAARTGTFSNSATPIDVGNGMKLRQVYTTNALVLVAYSGLGPNVHPTEVTVSMDGTNARYDVCLGATAGTDVVSTLPDDQVLVDKSSLTFAASQLPQTVTVSASPGATRSEGLIRHSASSGTPVASVRVIIEGVVPPDADPPVTSAEATPSANLHGWHRTNVDVQLAATDAGTGVASIDWALSGAQNGTGSSSGNSASVAVSAEGITTLTYFARDIAGNVEAPKALVIRIDRTAPTIAVTRDPLPNPDGWNFTDVVATFAASDVLSGIDGSDVAEVLFNQNGANQSATRSFSDKAGNVASATVSGISIDKRPATIACSATPNEIWPPNGQMVPVSINVQLERAEAFVLAAIRTNEPADGDVADFAIGSNDVTGRVRAVRSGSSRDGRVYTFEYRTVGGAAPASATCEVRVPHDRGRGK